MDKFVIEGGVKLSGRTKIGGAKNSALALIPATLLNSSVNKIDNVPEVNDVYTMLKVMNTLGAETKFENHSLEINTTGVSSQVAPYELVKKMRASVYVLGPLLSKFGYAKVSMPGGCAWGPRPINLHLEAMKKMGASVELEEGYIVAKTDRLKGARLHFDISSVGATGNALMASVLAKGETIISNAAIEPEITQLAEFLIKMGAKINGLGTTILEIQGVDELNGSEITNIGDRIEASTILIAGAITKGNIEIEYAESEFIQTVLLKLEDSGVKISKNNKIIGLDASDISPKNINIVTGVYPGFPTDAQAQWTAYMSIAAGTTRVTDKIYIDRFKHVPELNRLGANIQVVNNSAIINGVNNLKGAKVMSTDLRASASLVLAGLAAEGTTEVLRVYHIDRGYQHIEQKLKDLGARITRVSTAEF